MNIEKRANIIWLTGMSGSGKTTHACNLDQFFKKHDYTVKIIDGDDVRDKDNEKLGFGYKDVQLNNLRIAYLCKENRARFDFLIVPVISPYDEIRKEVRKILSPGFHLVFMEADIDSLKERDTKGFYAAADRGEIIDLIGYSKCNPYETPDDAEIIINTGDGSSMEESKKRLFDYFNSFVTKN